MPYSVPRYLVAFQPKQIPHHFVDVLVIGGGIAGMRATMAIDPRLSALVVTKDRLKESSSSYAQGVDNPVVTVPAFAAQEELALLSIEVGAPLD